ncbi:MAG: HAMP domain-containing histidine kinase [Lewinella sp.]|nr:HAMP domain-containing histidine kinase [Lewinella sp.]
MSKRITILLAIMLFCLSGLLLTQGYLAYQEFQRQQRDLSLQLNELFAQAIAAETNARLDRLTDLFLADLDRPELVRIEVRRDTETPRMIFDLFDGNSNELATSVNFKQIDLLADTLSPPLLQAFREQMARQVRGDLADESIVFWTDTLGGALKRHAREMPVDTAALHVSFEHSLDSLGITTAYKILIDSTFETTSSGSRKAVFYTKAHPLFGPSWIGDQQAMAMLKNPAYTIFRRSLFTIAGSASVILLTLLSFFLLFATILRQKKLSEMKDDFIDNVTHELQTPIAALRLALESLQQFSVTERRERFSRYLQVSTAELHRLSELVDSILQHSTGRETASIERESVNVMALLQEAAGRHHLRAEKPVFIQLPAIDTFEVFSSPFHLNTIVDNLLQNAIRYSDARGVHIDIRLRRQDDGFLLEIADDGWGIPPKDRRDIFEKFYRSSNKDRNYTIKGMGIGLYHVKQCVDALGGSIRVFDNRPRGTVMEVKL